MTKHSKEFIEEMKKALQSERQQLLDEIKQNQDFPDYGRNDEDNATEMVDFENTSATKKALEERLKNVEEAEVRIEEGIYGVTTAGEKIPEDRLRANPAAATLVK